MPDAAITTDIIVGFPGETEEDFLATLDVVRAARFSNAFTFQYSPRPGTPAATMDEQVPPDVVKDRYLRLVEVVNEIAWDENQALVGRSVELMVAEGEGRKDAATHRLSGRGPDSRLVHFNPVGADGVRPGDMVDRRDHPCRTAPPRRRRAGPRPYAARGRRRLGASHLRARPGRRRARDAERRCARPRCRRRPPAAERSARLTVDSVSRGGTKSTVRSPHGAARRPAACTRAARPPCRPSRTCDRRPAPSPAARVLAGDRRVEVTLQVGVTLRGRVVEEPPSSSTTSPSSCSVSR